MSEIIAVPSSSRAPSPSPSKTMALAQLVRTQFRENPILTIGGTWATILGGTIAFIWTRRIPLQLKIIQGRIVAQSALLGGCILGAIGAALFEPPRTGRLRETDVLSRYGAGGAFDGRVGATGSFDAVHHNKELK